MEMLTPELLHDAENFVGALEKFKVDIEKALCYSNNSHSFEDIVSGILDGTYHMHTLPNSVIIAEISVYPQHKVYNIVIAGGDLNEILNFQEPLLVAAKTFGCKYLAMTGRLGWMAPLRRQGWKAQTVTSYLEVNHG